MYQRFNLNNNISNFIKYLLANTDIPLIPFLDDYSNLPEGSLFIQDRYICKTVKEGKKLVKRKITPYIFGSYYNGLTTRFISNNSYYDGDTHYYLGQYLRAIKGYYGINLMPFYNCFNNTYIKDIFLKKTVKENEITITTIINPNTEYQEVAIPIKLGESYTIALDCPGEIIIQPIVYGNKGLASDSELIQLTSKLADKGEIIYNSTFRNPYVYTKLSTITSKDSDITDIGRFLKLIIQLPKGFNSSIVILEGDYTQNVKRWTETISEKGEKDYLSPLGLLQTPTDRPVAFSDRLIEYLFGQVITSEDNISENIERIQQYASSSICGAKNGVQLPYGSYTKGIYDENLRSFLFNLMKNTKNNFKMKIDINGFVDKDTERIVTRGQKV